MPQYFFTLCPTTFAILCLIGLMVYLSALALAASVDWLAGQVLSPCMPVLFIVLSQSAGLREARRTLALWQSYKLTSSLPQQIAPFRTNEWTCPLVNCHSFRQRNLAWNHTAELCLIYPVLNCAFIRYFPSPISRHVKSVQTLLSCYDKKWFRNWHLIWCWWLCEVPWRCEELNSISLLSCVLCVHK